MTAPPRAVEPEEPTPAELAQPLPDGLYVFPDGFKVRITNLYGCDFDTSVPCFGGTYRAEGTFKGKEGRVEWSTRAGSLLGHTIEVQAGHVVVVRASGAK